MLVSVGIYAELFAKNFLSGKIVLWLKCLSHTRVPVPRTPSIARWTSWTLSNSTTQEAETAAA